jgi:hypothetical protein
MDIAFFLGLLEAVLVWVVVCTLLSSQERIDRFHKWFPFTRYPKFRKRKRKWR